MTNSRDRNDQTGKRSPHDRPRSSYSRDRSASRAQRPAPKHTPLHKRGTQLGKPLAEAGYIVFDIETTGGNPQKNGITEIYAIKYCNGRIFDSFYSLVNPGIPIPPIVRRMTGIDNKMVQNAPRIDEVMPRFLDFIGDWILVSHNTIGDIQYLRHFALSVCRHQMENFFLCTHLLVERLAKEAPNKSLHGLAKFFDLPAGKLHRAEADAHLTMALFNVLRQKLIASGLQTVEQSIRFQGDFDSLMRLGWGVPDEQIDQLDAGPGVFTLCDHDGKALFSSSAISLQREVRKLSRFDQLPRSLARQVLRAYSIKAESTPSVFAALMREADICSRESHLSEPYHYHHRALQVVFVQQHATGARIGVGFLQEGVIEAIGPVSDRKVAHLWVQKLAQAFGQEVDRDGLILDKEFVPLLVAYFQDDLAAFEASLRSRVSALSNLVSPKRREMRRAKMAAISKLKDIPLPRSAKALLREFGFAVVKGGSEDTWIVHAVHHSRPDTHTQVRNDWQHKLPTLAIYKRQVPVMRKATKKPSLKPLTALESAKASAFLWWASANHHLKDGDFVPLDDQPPK